MRRLLCCLFALLLSNGLAARSDQDIIANLIKEQENAWNKGDLEGFMQSYWHSKELAFVGQNGIKYGRQTTLNNYKKNYPDKATMGKLKFELIKIETHLDSAFVLGQWKLNREKGNIQGFFSLYWKKINGQWKITIDHSS